MTDFFDDEFETEAEPAEGSEVHGGSEPFGATDSDDAHDFSALTELAAGNESPDSFASSEPHTEELESTDGVSRIPTSFGTVTGRLSEIADAIEDENVSLDDALGLLEEAVALGMRASSLLESDMDARDAAAEQAELAAEFAQDPLDAEADSGFLGGLSASAGPNDTELPPEGGVEPADVSASSQEGDG